MGGSRWVAGSRIVVPVSCTEAELPGSPLYLSQPMIQIVNPDQKQYLRDFGAGLVDLELERLLILTPRKRLNPEGSFSSAPSDPGDRVCGDFFRKKGMLNEVVVRWVVKQRSSSMGM